MEWNFVKLYYDGYRDVHHRDEYGTLTTTQEYGLHFDGYYGMAYLDGYLGDDGYHLDTKTLSIKNYVKRKKNLAKLTERVNSYPPDEEITSPKTLLSKQKHTNKLQFVLETIAGIENIEE